MAFATDGKVGVGFDRRTATPEFGLGTAAIGSGNTTWVYVKASAAINDATVVILTTPGFTAAAGAGDFTADTGFANGEYGWIRKTTSPLDGN
ncbi:hypothetical protein GN330_22650 [Nitratireductor sp. CAU 1489]|uniref:Uncharacterized protein n=1 Tax=Nitratireductor arenosus TaxID=2682096 RepID=A0A844QN91_9HYPH|nr:hypothetical protein [Nitratireductor arenosus]MVB00055.1 hypothetical protein [Nitratireductor arenosus]